MTWLELCMAVFGSLSGTGFCDAVFRALLGGMVASIFLKVVVG